MLLMLKEKRQNVRTAKRRSSAVIKQPVPPPRGGRRGRRLPWREERQAFLVLKVPRVYHQNQAAFLPGLEAAADGRQHPRALQRRARSRRWGKLLKDPKEAGDRRPAPGRARQARPSSALKGGLARPDDPKARFFAAEALAYLDDPSGVDALLPDGATRTLPEFRAHALAALAAMDHPASLAPPSQADGREADPRGPLWRLQRPADDGRIRPLPGAASASWLEEPGPPSRRRVQRHGVGDRRGAAPVARPSTSPARTTPSALYRGRLRGPARWCTSPGPGAARS